MVDAIEQLQRQALHAIKLSFIHPATGEVMNFKSRLPEDLRILLAALNFGEELAYEQIDDEEEDSNWEIIYVTDQD